MYLGFVVLGVGCAPVSSEVGEAEEEIDAATRPAPSPVDGALMLAADASVVADAGLPMELGRLPDAGVDARSSADALPAMMPGKRPASVVFSIVQGQSNAVLLTDWAVWSIYYPFLKRLTGIPTHTALASVEPGRTLDQGWSLNSSTPTYDLGANLWLDARGGGDPSRWPEGRLGIALRNYIRSSVTAKAAPGQPVLVIRFHSEYDTKKNGAEAAAYEAANLRFVTLIREWIGKPVAEVPIFYGSPAFWSGTQTSGLEAVRTAWYRHAREPAANAHWMFGQVEDCNDLGDASHMNERGQRQAAQRLTIAAARWLHDNGYAHTDLSWLPRLGPRIAAVKRVPDRANQLDLSIAHDKGTDLMVPPRPAFGIFRVRDNGISRPVIALERVNATTLRLTLDASLTGTDPQITVDVGLSNGFYGPGNLVLDNWHTLPKPAWATEVFAAYQDGTDKKPTIVLPLRKTLQPVAVGSPAAESPDDR